jgi:hypothetical protein
MGVPGDVRHPGFGSKRMAEEAQQELTPEEKLLEVIQKGEAPQADIGTDSAPTLGDESDGQPISRPILEGSGVFRISTFNKVLVLVAVVFLGLSVYEMYQNLPEQQKTYSAVDMGFSEGGEVLVLASLSDTLDMFSKRRIFGVPPKPWARETNGVTIETLQGWRAYARDNLKLMGTSDVQRETGNGDTVSVLEAIVMDTKEKKMHFLTTGQTIVLSTQDVRVDKVGENRVDLQVEDERLTIE